MEHKRACYNQIQQRGAAEIARAINRELQPWGDSQDENMMCQEVLRECQQAREFNVSKY